MELFSTRRHRQNSFVGGDTQRFYFYRIAPRPMRILFTSSCYKVPLTFDRFDQSIGLVHVASFEHFGVYFKTAIAVKRGGAEWACRAGYGEVGRAGVAGWREGFLFELLFKVEIWNTKMKNEANLIVPMLRTYDHFIQNQVHESTLTPAAILTRKFTLRNVNYMPIVLQITYAKFIAVSRFTLTIPTYLLCPICS